MPREHRKRGRPTDGPKRKREADDVDDEQRDAKRFLTTHDDEINEDPLTGGNGEVDEQAYDDGTGADSTPFYGLLDEDEQQYFKRADEMLEFNSFGNAEERDLFLENVFKEAEGKALKLACSQSCSRLLERLIAAAKPQQLKIVFQELSGNFSHLFQHRFASHCCEQLFLRAAPFTSNSAMDLPVIESKEAQVDGPATTFESLFLSTVDELENDLGYLLPHRFASHTFRVLLLVLAGQSVSAHSSLVRSKRKERLHSESSNGDTIDSKAPPSFNIALRKVLYNIVSGLETSHLRVYATHPTGNPSLQLLLRLETMEYGKQKANEHESIIHKLLPDDPLAPRTESAIFIHGLMFDPVGSHLLETILEFAPGKLFKAIYRNFMVERLPSLAKDDVASHVVCKALERLSKEDLEQAAESLIPLVPILLDRNRINVIKCLLERGQARQIDLTNLAKEIASACRGPQGFSIRKLLRLDEPADPTTVSPRNTANSGSSAHPHAGASKLSGSLLAQAMINASGEPSELVFNGLVEGGSSTAIEIALDSAASRTLQAALASLNASIIFRRKMIQLLYGHVAELAAHPAGSHVVDAVWEGTHGLAFIRERIAEELAENESGLHATHAGRAVWRNWKMNLYKRQRAEWVRLSRNSVGNNGFQSFPEGGQVNEPGKTRIQLAREKHAALKAAERRKGRAQKQAMGMNTMEMDENESPESEGEGPSTQTNQIE